MQAVRMGKYYEHVCTNPSCLDIYYDLDPVAGLCMKCRKKASKGKDTILMQTELVPVKPAKIPKPVQDDFLEVLELIWKAPEGETNPQRGFFQELTERVNGVIDGMEVKWRISTKTLRKILEIPAERNAMSIFLHRALEKARADGRLKRVNEKAPYIYEKIEHVEVS